MKQESSRASVFSLFACLLINFLFQILTFFAPKLSLLNIKWWISLSTEKPIDHKLQSLALFRKSTYI